MSPDEAELVEVGRLLGGRVTVKVKGDRTLVGVLKQHDNYMNLLLDDVEEREGDKVIAKHSVMLVKGGNVQSVTSARK